MTMFDDRERAFETKYARELEYDFIVNAKACSLFARWVAEDKLGLKPHMVERYCAKIISLTIKDCNPQTLFDYMQHRLQRHKVDISNKELEYQYFKALQTVKATV